MPNPSYLPQSGSAGARAIAFLQREYPDGEATSAAMAAELKVTSSALGAYLASVVHHKLVTRDRREHQVFWKLGPRTGSDASKERRDLRWVGPPATAAPVPVDDLDEVDHAPPIARVLPAAAAAPLAGVTQQSWCPAALEGSSEVLADEPAPQAAPTSLGLGWKAPTVPVFRADPPAAAGEDPAASATGDRALDALEQRHAQAVRQVTAPSINDQAVQELAAALAPRDLDFREVDRAPAPPEPDTPPRGAEAAHAPASPQCGRDDATPKNGVVPQGLDGGFRCALWSNGMLELYTSEGELLLLNADDTRGLLRYTGDMLSARARAGV